MKRILSTILSIATTLSLITVPAFAIENTADQRLTDITIKTKQLLNIGNEYTNFYGDLVENELVSHWDLNWSSDDANLSVTATESGKISYYYYSSKNKDYDNYRYGTIPKISNMQLDEAKDIAESFVKNLLDKNQAIGETDEYYSIYDSTFREQGSILLNGLNAGLSFDITVDINTLKVTRFSQTVIEEMIMGDIPSSESKTDLNIAKDKLKSTLDFDLVYQLDKDSKTAVLKYIPKTSDEYYVDAQTGELINLSELYRKVNGKLVPDYNKNMNNMEGSSEDSITGNASGLTEVEKQGIEKMEGVLSKDQIQSKLRSIKELGLDQYNISSINYRLNTETNEVIANISLSSKTSVTDKSKSISCNAKTCELISVSSWNRRDNDKTVAKVSGTEAEKLAHDFISKLWKTETDSTKLKDKSLWTKDSYNNQHTFTYVQNVNDIYLPSNSITVGIDIDTGCISTLRKNWTYNIKFESLDNIITKDEAIDIWSKALNTELVYERVPVKISEVNHIEPLYDKLIEAGYSYFYKFKLAYVDNKPSTESYTSIVAKTGEIEKYKYNVRGSKYYTDIDGYKYQSEIEILNKFGIGWDEDKCLPNKTVTQLDMIKLVLSTLGYSTYYRNDNAEEILDRLYETAYRMGIITKAERNQNLELKVEDVVKMLLNSCGYKDVAKLNIYNQSNGYIAIAKGFGMIDSDASTIASRGDALHMMYKLINR